MKVYFVYILYSEVEDKFYKGQTSNLNDRLVRHNTGQEKSTRAGVPWILIWSTTKGSRSEAMRLEEKVKNLSRMRLINFIKKYQEGIAGHDEAILINRLS